VSPGRLRTPRTTLHASVRLELANRLRAHVLERDRRHTCQGTLSDFISAAIEEKIARDQASQERRP
jgi:hypothetical protein